MAGAGVNYGMNNGWGGGSQPQYNAQTSFDTSSNNFGLQNASGGNYSLMDSVNGRSFG